MTSPVYICPACGHKVFSERRPNTHRQRHPKFDEIEADLAKGVHISYIRDKYNLTRNQAAGLYARFWEKTRARSYRQW